MSITVIEAGRKGGFTVLQRYGRQFFAEIGEKGQKAMRQKYPDMAVIWGKKGGRPKKLSLGLVMGERSK
jgi:general stress protein YciG